MSLIRLVVAALVLAASGCGEAGGAQLPAASSPDVAITAAQMAFDLDELRVPAGEPLAVLLRNRDGALHNLAIYREGGGNAVFVGEFIGSGEILYSVPPLDPGRYVLRCDLHPSMTGAIVAS